MSERLLRTIAFTAAASAAAAGCGLVEADTPNNHDPEVIRQEIRNDYAGLPHIQIENIDIADNEVGELSLTVVPEALQPPSSEVLERTKNAITFISAIIDGRVAEGSGFLFYDDEQNKVMMISAGHVFSGVDPNTINITTNDGQHVEFESVTSYFHPLDIENDEDPKYMEDIAIVELKNPELFKDRALTARDLGAPLLVGDQFYAFGYAEESHPGQPNIYSMIFSQLHFNEKFGVMIGDVEQGVDSDDARPGESGEPLVDRNGNLVGVVIAGVADEATEFYCGDDISADFREFGGNTAEINLVISETNDECDEGLPAAIVRRVNSAGGFVPNELTQPEVIVNSAG